MDIPYIISRRRFISACSSEKVLTNVVFTVAAVVAGNAPTGVTVYVISARATVNAWVGGTLVCRKKSPNILNSESVNWFI